MRIFIATFFFKGGIEERKKNPVLVLHCGMFFQCYKKVFKDFGS